MTTKPVQFAALVLTALMLIAPGAHLFSLPNKIGLVQEQYYLVQMVYRGWHTTGFIIFAALFANLTLAYRQRADTTARNFALLAAALIVAGLGVFFLTVFPANQATQNWTAQPADWESLRRHWEYGHAVNAAVSLAAFCATAWSVLTAKPR
jgi:Na+/melibiose symporter-like transporter